MNEWHCATAYGANVHFGCNWMRMIAVKLKQKTLTHTRGTLWKWCSALRNKRTIRTTDYKPRTIYYVWNGSTVELNCDKNNRAHWPQIAMMRFPLHYGLVYNLVQSFSTVKWRRHRERQELYFIVFGWLGNAIRSLCECCCWLVIVGGTHTRTLTFSLRNFISRALTMRIIREIRHETVRFCVSVRTIITYGFCVLYNLFVVQLWGSKQTH